MCVINFSNNEKDIASINISLTSEPPYLNHIVGLCISLTGYPFYLTDIFNLLISLTAPTLIYPLMTSLAHTLRDSTNAVRYPT